MRNGWSETTLGMVTTHFRGTVKVEDGIPYPASGVMMEGRGLIDREPFIGGISGYKKLTPIAPGQLVLRSITAWEAPITIVPVGYIGRHVSGVFPVLNLDESQLDAGFMRLVCQWPVFWNEMRMRATGSVLRRKTLSANQLQQIPLNLPPLDEQKRIVDVVSSVDAYIDALLQQVDSARTARNAVLHECLSSGGDNWTETTLGDIARLIIGRTPSRSEKKYWTEDLAKPFCTIADMDGKWVTPSREGVTDAAIHEGKARLVSAGSLMMSFKLTLGRVGFARVDLYPNEAIVAIDVEPSRGTSDYLYLVLGYQDLSHGSGRAIKGATLNSKSLANIPLNLPPLEEQKRIVEIVSSMDDVIQATEQAVTDAKNLRSGLLSDLLSGEHEIPASYDVFVGAA
jgi:type I restriction enzyme S subunit